jgi:hypothetical protein
MTSEMVMIKGFGLAEFFGATVELDVSLPPGLSVGPPILAGTAMPLPVLRLTPYLQDNRLEPPGWKSSCQSC